MAKGRESKKVSNFPAKFRKHLELFEFLSIAPRAQLKILCKQLPTEIVELLSNIARNILKNPSIDLNSDQKRVLKKHKRHISQLAKLGVSNKNKSKLLSQKGHIIIPHLLAPTLKIFGN